MANSGGFNVSRSGSVAGRGKPPVDDFDLVGAVGIVFVLYIFYQLLSDATTTSGCRPGG